MKKCVITQSAVEAIREISSPASEAGKETGGILIGPTPTDSAIFVTSATGPGPDSSKASRASWETDPVYLNEKLKAARDEDASVNLRGFWHLHPDQLTGPSGQDLSEARNILLDTGHYRLNGELVMPIVTATNGRIVIHGYRITSEDLQFREMPMEVVSDRDEMVGLLLPAEETRELEIEADGGFWVDVDWQFYRSAYGATRLEAEVNELEDRGYEVTARLIDGGCCCIEARKGENGYPILFSLPREYPLNPPRVYLTQRGDVKELGVDGPSMLNRWSSELHLWELMESEIRKRLRAYSRYRKRHEILSAIKEDFRHGRLGIGSMMKQLLGLARGC